MPALRIALLSCIAVVSLPPHVQADAFTIDEWFLSTGISYNSGSEGEFSNVVQNPFDHTHFSSMGNSTAASQFQFAWAEAFGALLIEATHQAEGVETDLLFTVSSGFIWMTPTEHLSLSIAAEYTYSLPADLMLAALAITVFDADDPLYELFGENESYNTTYGAPASGTFSIDGLVTLPPNHTWILAYSMKITTAEGTSGHMATGSGFVDFQITPEPATLCLLALGALGLLKRNRPRGC